ncbi:MAG: transglycosylase SLT domain-containing protein [Bacteroidota bacterium]|nr:transglycosylase SLT domain-containing protein [Bacteroidota bacterium]
MKIVFKISLVLLLTFLLQGKIFHFSKWNFGDAFADESSVHQTVAKSTTGNKPSSKLHEYRKIVDERAKANDLDSKLILAIIKQESQFNENAVSERGAQGLMQLMPKTQFELSDDSLDSFHPEKNIKLGVSYFSKLYKLFENAPEEDRICLALAAYNAGPSRIYDAQDLAAYLGEDPLSWRSIQNALPLLSKRYYTLHQPVWDGGKPRNGYFGSWRQTILYVQNVLKFHKDIQ